MTALSTLLFFSDGECLGGAHVDRVLHFVAGVSIRELQRQTGLGRNTIRRALRSDGPPVYVRQVGASKLDGYREEIQRLLGEIRGCRGSGSLS